MSSKKCKPLVERVADIIPHNFPVIGHFKSYEDDYAYRHKVCVKLAKRIINMVTKHNQQMHREAGAKILGDVIDTYVKKHQEYRDRAEEG